MGYRSGNNYRILMGFETSLGSGMTYSSGGAEPTLSNRFGDMTVIQGMLVITPDRQLIETGYRSGTAQATFLDNCQGVYDGTFTLSGMLNPKDVILLQAAFHHGDTFQFNDTPNHAKSFLLMRLWDDPVDQGKYVYDIAEGCRVDELVITGASKGLIEFTMTGRITDAKDEVKDIITGVLPEIKAPNCVQFGDVVYSGSYGEQDRLHEFTLTVRNVYDSDEHVYANSNKRSKDIILRQEAELNIKSIYLNQIIYNKNEMGNKGIGQGKQTITLKDENDEEWKIELYAKLMSLNPADHGRDNFETNVDVIAIKYGANPALKITHTSA